MKKLVMVLLIIFYSILLTFAEGKTYRFKYIYKVECAECGCTGEFCYDSDVPDDDRVDRIAAEKIPTIANHSKTCPRHQRYYFTSLSRTTFYHKFKYLYKTNFRCSDCGQEFYAEILADDDEAWRNNKKYYFLKTHSRPGGCGLSHTANFEKEIIN